MASFRTRRPLGLIGQLIIGSICFSTGAVFLYFIAADYTLLCDRTDNRCSLQAKHIFRAPEAVAEFALTSLKGAEIQESRDSKGKSHYKVMLVTDGIRIPFTDGLNPSYGSCNKTTNKINTFINSTDPNCTISESGLILKIFGFVFAFAGAYVLLQAFGRILIRVLKLVLFIAK